MTRDEIITEASEMLLSIQAPIFTPINTENWWLHRETLCDLVNQYRSVINRLDDARIAEEIESGSRQPYIPRQLAPSREKPTAHIDSLLEGL